MQLQEAGNFTRISHIHSLYDRNCTSGSNIMSKQEAIDFLDNVGHDGKAVVVTDTFSKRQYFEYLTTRAKPKRKNKIDRIP